MADYTLVYNRTWDGLARLQELYRRHRDENTVLSPEELTEFQDYYVSKSAVSRWQAALADLQNLMKKCGLQVPEGSKIDSFDQPIVTNTNSDTVEYISYENKYTGSTSDATQFTAQSKRSAANVVHTVIQSCILAINMVAELYPVEYSNEITLHNLDTDELPEKMACPWSDLSSCADYLDIVDINWLEAGLLISCSALTKVIEQSFTMATAVSGTAYSGSEVHL